MRYDLTEVFQSIQGEGLYIGQPCTFIRLAGCPIGCTFCDTDYSVRINADENEILRMVDPLLDHVVITGGEPMMQDLTPLLRLLQRRSFFVQMETSGWAQNEEDLSNIYGDCGFVTLSPKEGVPIPPLIFGEVKWLVPLHGRTIQWNLSRHHWLQPINHGLQINKEHLNSALELLRTTPVPMGKTLRLSPQVHKLIGVR